MCERVKRAADWDFPIPPFLAEAIDNFADGVESKGATIPSYLSLADYLMDIESGTRELDEEHEAIIRAYYL